MFATTWGASRCHGTRPIERSMKSFGIVIQATCRMRRSNRSRRCVRRSSSLKRCWAFLGRFRASLGVPPFDLYDYLMLAERRLGRPVKHDLAGWRVTDDWPRRVPVTERAQRPAGDLPFDGGRDHHRAKNQGRHARWQAGGRRHPASESGCSRVARTGGVATAEVERAKTRRLARSAFARSGGPRPIAMITIFAP